MIQRILGQFVQEFQKNGSHSLLPHLRKTTSIKLSRRFNHNNANSNAEPIPPQTTKPEFHFVTSVDKNQDNEHLRLIFDSPEIWSDFVTRCQTIAALEYGNSLTNKRKPTGLFGNPELATPNGFRVAAKKALRRVHLLVQRIVKANTDDELRKVVKNLDRLSDTLCSVIDTAEFTRTAHPDQKFTQAANWAYEHLYSYMNTLNTNTELYQVLKNVISTPRISSKFSTEELQVAKIFLRDFEKSGIHLSSAEREKFVQLSDKIITLGRKFTHNQPQRPINYIDVDASLLNELKISSVINKKANIARISTKPWDAQVVLKHVKSEKVRKAMFIASNSATEEQVKTLENLLKIRGELALLLGMESYSQIFLIDKMVKNPENVQTFLRTLADRHRTKALEDLRLIQIAKQQEIQSESLPTVYAWDRDYYTEKIKESSPTQPTTPISPYFSVGSVIQGLSKLFSRLYGISFRPAEIMPGEVWNEDVRKLEVIDENEGKIGIIYCDLFNRFGKYQNAAHYTVRCSRRVDDDDSEGDISTELNITELGELPDSEPGETIKGRNGRYQLPVVVLMCDFANPTNSKGPSLLNWLEVETLFHEMGHAMHSMIGRTDFHNVSGTRCPTDFVELPSILMEHFVYSPSVLSLFAKHYQTRDPMPIGLIHSHLNARSQFSAMETQYQILMALLDQLYHSNLATSSTFDTTSILANLQDTVGLFPSVSKTSWQIQFGHLYGYGSGYFSYLFCKMLAGKIWKDIFEKDPLSRDAGQLFKKEVLRWGGSRDPWLCVGKSLKDERIMAGDSKSVSIVGEWIDCL
ncbi:6219_t:CDS:2 [Diversispora eburnea]|uniref:mitochondrial intermediate peptidase n=1 Tax=Diversispora eburnea TaxID=1213867 RepID=A0A9N8YNG0_9GLOM|nr:6219_t:CDS:2 [Diversispora eburnea]